MLRKVSFSFFTSEPVLTLVLDPDVLHFLEMRRRDLVAVKSVWRGHIYDTTELKNLPVPSIWSSDKLLEGGYVGTGFIIPGAHLNKRLAAQPPARMSNADVVSRPYVHTDGNTEDPYVSQEDDCLRPADAPPADFNTLVNAATASLLDMTIVEDAESEHEGCQPEEDDDEDDDDESRVEVTYEDPYAGFSDDDSDTE